jgi:cytoplasmic iron level regulating protein YaaA (DUF328/UPF0246 family)
MLILLSPSKTMDIRKVKVCPEYTEPIYKEKALQLAVILRKYNVNGLSELLNISHNLAQSTYERYQTFTSDYSDPIALQAIFAFTGDVYTSLNATTFSPDDLEFSQKHLRILSGLYGYLRPYDLIQAYRLEMATKMNIGKSTNLYVFWKKSLHEAIKNDLNENKTRLIINLASNEYFKSIDIKTLDCKVVTPVFMQEVNGKLKIISIFAKQARGSMTAFIVKNKLTDPEHLSAFNELGYTFNSRLSSQHIPTFTR